VKTPLAEVLQRADSFFMRTSSVHQAATRIAKELTKLEIPFVIAGGLAVGVHGHLRLTEDVDVLLNAEGLARFKETWLGRGWVERTKGSRGMRDAVANVNIDVLLSGDFPGDGKPKPVAFPDPALVADVDSEPGYPVLRLATLIQLKLASGMTAAHRLKDLADVIELVRANQLEQAYGDQLNPFVQEKFCELWTAAQHQDDL
jgi:hypothetical protein